jgi:hypothetical protein
MGIIRKLLGQDKPTLVTRTTDQSATYVSQRTIRNTGSAPGPIVKGGKHEGKPGRHRR